MKKTEQLIAVEDFLSVKGVSLESFYVITIWEDKIVLQGKFSSDIIKRLGGVAFKVSSNGYAETSIEINTPEGIILINITLT